MMNIYSFPTFNLTKILLTAEEVGQPYHLELLDFANGGHKTPEHLARHPLGKVPAVELDGKSYFESNSICRLLAEKHGSLYGQTPEQRAETNQWVDMISFHVGRWLTVQFFEQAIKPAFFGGQPDEAAVAEATEFLDQQLPAVEAQLGKHHYLAGDELTIADFVAVSYFTTTEYSGVDLTSLPNIRRWMANVCERPSYQKAMANFPGNDIFNGLNKTNVA